MEADTTSLNLMVPFKLVAQPLTEAWTYRGAPVELIFASTVKLTIPVSSSVQTQEEIPRLVHAEPSTTAFAAQRHNKRESGNMLELLEVT